MSQTGEAEVLSWHDGLLSTIAIDQQIGTASLVIREIAGEGVVLALGRGVVGVSYSRLAPWGPSDSVNRATLMRRSGDTPATLSIELQSGDYVTILAEQFEIRTQST